MTDAWICGGFLAGLLIAWLAEPTCMACKYSVRDVGFVDLSSQRYDLVLVVDEADDAKLAELQLAVQAELLDSNVRLRAAKSGSNTPAEGGGRSITLRTPSGSELNIAVAAGDLEQAFAAAARNVVQSSLRAEIQQALFTAHSVILVVEGTDADINRLALDIADAAVQRIESGLKSLPKPIQRRPQVITLKAEHVMQESVLLQSLALSQARDATAHLVMLFGRMRLLADPIAVPSESVDDVLRLLSYVGQDCECELDRAVMQGVMLPHIWNSRHEARIAKELGFDPGNPVVQVEISRILAKGPASGRRNLAIGVTAFDGGLGGYQEIELPPLVDDDANSVADATEPPPVEADSAPVVDHADGISASEHASADVSIHSTYFDMPLGALAVGLVVVMSVVGCLLVLVLRRQG